MCNKYETTPPSVVEAYFRAAAEGKTCPPGVFPRTPGPFIRRARDVVGYERELVVGTWGLIPWFAKEPKLKFPTNNARSEELEAKGQLQRSVEARSALHHSGVDVRRAKLGEREERLVAVQARRW